MKKVLFFALVGMLTQGFSALSTYHQGSSEIKRMLDHPDIVKQFGQSDMISEIKLIENAGTYRLYSLSSGQKTVAVKLEYKKSERCGPRLFDIQITPVE